jgi:hypothetical protein
MIQSHREHPQAAKFLFSSQTSSLAMGDSFPQQRYRRGFKFTIVHTCFFSSQMQMHPISGPPEYHYQTATTSVSIGDFGVFRNYFSFKNHFADAPRRTPGASARLYSN